MGRASHALEGHLLEEDFPACVRAGDLIFVSARIAVEADGRVRAPGDVRGQTQIALGELEQALKAAGASMADIVDVLSFHLDPRQIGDVLDVAGPCLGPDPPAWTPVVMAAPPYPGVLVSISAVANASGCAKTCVVPDTIAWWRGLGVSAGCRKGDLVAVAGQFGSDADGNVNTPGDHAGQARNALNRVKEISMILGGDLEDMVDLLSFHQDPRGIEASETVLRGEFLGSGRQPTWTPVGVPAILRFGMLGQFRALACPGLVSASCAPGAGAGGGDPKAQAVAACDALDSALEDVGVGPADLVAITSYHKDMRDLGVFREVLLGLCGEQGPTWTPVGMTGFPDPDASHCLHALAVTA